MADPAGRKTNHRARSGARRLLVQALYQWQLSGEDPSGGDLSFLRENPHGRPDLAYFETLFHKVVSGRERIDGLITQCIDRDFGALDPVERAILRLATAELLYEPEVPYRVVINEAVELAKTFAADESYRYVNGVVDRLAPALRPDEVSARRGA